MEQGSSQINQQTGSETQELTNIYVKRNKNTRGRKRHTNRRTSRLTVDTRTQRVKQKMKNEAPYVRLLLK